MAMEYGRSVEHSVRVMAVKSTGDNPRYVSEWALAEISYTPFRGANPNTPLIDIKADDIQFAEYCYNNGRYSDCRMKKFESLLEAGNKPLLEADDTIIGLLKNINF